MSIIQADIFTKIIIVLQLICGFYWKISSNKVVNALVRAYCVSITATVIVIITYEWFVTLYRSVASIVVFAATFYFVNIFVDLFSNGENFMKFIKNIRQPITQDIRSSVNTPITAILLISTICIRVFSHLKFQYDNGMWNPLISEATLILVIDIILYVSNSQRIMMFELLWRKMAALRNHLERDLSSARRYETREDLLKNKLKACVKIYNNILNSTRMIDAQTKFLMLTTVTILMVQVLNQLYVYIIEFKDYNTSVFLLEIPLRYITSLSPALLAEMVNSEIDKMKLCIVKQLLVCHGTFNLYIFYGGYRL
nr:uncharacterized protein LOC126053769 [Helicoverpa armigera]